jgi:5S rRNA maturation endonuclease (ribonuclease M5)
LIDIQEYLEEKGQWVKRAGSHNIKTYCPIHGEDENSAGRLYVNVDESDDRWGLWTCFVCNAKGNINKLREHFGDPPIDAGTGGNIDYPILESATQYYVEKLFENPEAYRYLTEARGLSDQMIVNARLGWADGGLTAHLLNNNYTMEQIQATGLVNKFGEDYHRDKIAIPYLEYGRPIQIRGKQIGGKCIGVIDVPVDLYGRDSILGEETVIIAEGEPDQWTLEQFGFAAVGIPGANTWKEDQWNEYFVDAKRIYIMLDPDGPGKRGAETIAASLGPRCRIVELPKKGVDVNDLYVKYGKQKEDFEYLMSKAKGGLLVTVKEAYEMWTEIEGNDRLAGLRTNIGPLDRAMHFGLLPGQVMTLLARTGVGKSIWSINLFHRMKMLDPDVKILFASLEQGRNEWFERAHRIHNFYEPGVTVADTVKFWENNMLILDKNRITEAELTDSVDQYSYEAGKVPDLICVDYLGYYARGFPGDAKEKTIAAMMGIKAIAREYGTVIYTPHQANRTGIMGQEVSIEMSKDSSTVEETSDVMLTVWSPDHVVGSTENTGEIHQKLVKCRNGGVGTMIRYQYAPLTLAMVPVEDSEYYKRALNEKAWNEANDTWKEAVQRHKTNDMSLNPLPKLDTLSKPLTAEEVRAKILATRTNRTDPSGDTYGEEA